MRLYYIIINISIGETIMLKKSITVCFIEDVKTKEIMHINSEGVYYFKHVNIEDFIENIFNGEIKSKDFVPPYTFIKEKTDIKQTKKDLEVLVNAGEDELSILEVEFQIRIK